MLSKIKEWFVALPNVCQKEFAHPNGDNLISGKFKNNQKNSLEAFLNYMESESLSYEEVLKRTLILYSVIDMTINLKLSINWNIPQNLIDAINNSRTEVSNSIETPIDRLAKEWVKDGDEAIAYSSQGKELWDEINRNWTELKNKELNIIELTNFTIQYLS